MICNVRAERREYRPQMKHFHMVRAQFLSNFIGAHVLPGHVGWSEGEPEGTGSARKSPQRATSTSPRTKEEANAHRVGRMQAPGSAQGTRPLSCRQNEKAGRGRRGAHTHPLQEGETMGRGSHVDSHSGGSLGAPVRVWRRGNSQIEII